LHEIKELDEQQARL